MRRTRSVRTPALTAVLVAILLSPLAGAHTTCEEHAPAPPPEGTPVPHYLLTGPGGDLGLSNLPASAKNRTFWSTTLTSSGETEQRTVRLNLPRPDYVVNEDGRIRGHFRVSVREVSEDPVQLSNGQPKLELNLVQGERSVQLVGPYAHYHYAGFYTHYSYDPYRYYWDYRFDRGFPGHDPAAPHTHGDGGSAERRLHASDLQVEFRFAVVPDATVTSLTPVSYEFNILIDGTTFLQLYSLETLDAPVEGETEGPAAGNETVPPQEPAPEDSSEAQENATSESGASQTPGQEEPAEDPTTPASIFQQASAQRISLAVIAGLASIGTGLGSFAWVRARRA